MVEAPDLPDAQIDQWVAGLAARIGRGLDTRNGVTLAATLVDRGASMPPVVVVALHPCVADQAGLALLLTELNAALQSRSEEHTSELQSLIRNSYPVFCLKKKNHLMNHCFYYICTNYI